MANDAYEAYYAEKLWELVPAVYRDEDGKNDPGGVLRAIVDLVADEAAKLRRSQDHLWDDSFIELCDDWAIPYIGDLVSVEPLSALNPRGRRIDVAKAIYYRRRKGTPYVLEELIVDITGWEGILREGFQRVARARHRLDPPIADNVGRFSRTPPGGFADLRNARAAEMSGGPFDEFAHTPDMRAPSGLPTPGLTLGGLPGSQRHRGALATAGIRKVGFHIYRLGAYEIEEVQPALIDGATGFTFDPSGRDVPLFQHAAREKGGGEGISGTGFADWHAAEEWELPAPMRCRVLGHAEYVFSEAAIAVLAGETGFNDVRQAQLRLLVGQRLRGTSALHRALALLPDGAFFTDSATLQIIRAETLSTDCGKAVLVSGSVAVMDTPPTALTHEDVVAGQLAQWSTDPDGYSVVIDPERGRLRFPGGAPAAQMRVSYYVGLPGEIGAGTYSRAHAAARTPDQTISGGGAIAHTDLSDTGVIEIADSLTYDLQPTQTTVRDLVLQGHDGARPYLRRGANWRLISGQDNAVLTLDGLWLGASASYEVQLEGSFSTVTLANMTLDPGGAQTEDSGAPVLPAVTLVVKGEVDRLVIDHSIIGPISVDANGAINRLVIRDSIVQDEGGGSAITQPLGETILERATIMGGVDVQRLYATETLISGRADVLDNQTGCFRYGAAGKTSRLPKPYRSHVLSGVSDLFTSRRFGNPGYGQLSLAAPKGVRQGAENGSEIGAFNDEMAPIRLDGLRTRAAQYMPFGLVPFFITET